MDNNTPKPQNQIQLELKPEIAKGSYSNLAIISHSRSEFIIDFATTLPGLAKPEIGNRIIMTPEHAKRLMPQQGGGTFNLADFGPLGGGSKS